MMMKTGFEEEEVAEGFGFLRHCQSVSDGKIEEDWVGTREQNVEWEAIWR